MSKEVQLKEGPLPTVSYRRSSGDWLTAPGYALNVTLALNEMIDGPDYALTVVCDEILNSISDC